MRVYTIDHAPKSTRQEKRMAKADDGLALGTAPFESVPAAEEVSLPLVEASPLEVADASGELAVLDGSSV